MPRAPETCFDCGRPIDGAETLLGDAAFHPACAEAFCIRNADEIGGKPCARCGGTGSVRIMTGFGYRPGIDPIFGLQGVYERRPCPDCKVDF
tara:strand:- start:1466 stop:1741 length:276 start_codon:yes stop_codon:yes gene_type:complete